MAVGLSVKRENLPKLQKEFEELAKEANIKEKVPVINLEDVINIDEITKEDVESLNLLEPLGEKNKRPIFAFRNLKIDSIRSLTEGKHLKLTLKSNNNTLVDAIGFNLGYLAEEYILGDKVDIARKSGNK